MDDIGSFLPSPRSAGSASLELTARHRPSGRLVWTTVKGLQMDAALSHTALLHHARGQLSPEFGALPCSCNRGCSNWLYSDFSSGIRKFRNFSRQNFQNFRKCKCNKFNDECHWRTSAAAAFKQSLMACTWSAELSASHTHCQSVCH